MKKKFLSLMMAAAVVATTSVSAFAADKTITGEDDKEQTTKVTITGDIANDSNEFKPGTFNVTVPTTATFTVANKGEFTGASLTVRNNGTQQIDVYAKSFVDTNGMGGVQVIESSTVTTSPENVERYKVALRLRGNQNTAYFKTGDTSGSGVFQNLDLTGPGGEDGVKLSTISPSENDTLELEGEAGKKISGITNAIKDTFTLTLRIKKAQ